MAKKQLRGLGRGLGALLGDDVEEISAPATQAQPEEEQPRDEVRMLPISVLDPNREQPRRSFDETALNELAQSVQAMGVLQPIIVAPGEDGRYTIIAGERRFRASRLAGLSEIPAIVRDWDTQTRLEAALVENLQRDDLNPVEEAMGVRKLMDDAGLTQEQVSQRIGKSRPAVANLLRLLMLPEAVLELLRTGKLSAGHARALVTVDRKRKIQLANLTVQQGWSVRQLERICAQPVAEEPRKPRVKRDPQLGKLESTAREVFGTRVKLDGDESRGKITLYYYNSEDLQRIWDVIVGEDAL